jgi:predicted HTH transcriptional regulator
MPRGRPAGRVRRHLAPTQQDCLLDGDLQRQAVLALLAEEPGLSLPEVAQRLRKSPRAIERAVKSLREAGRLQRIGPAKGGYWQVIE